MAEFIYPEKDLGKNPLIIHLGKDDSPYQVLHEFLHDLYWAQNMDGGYCYGDMLVVWDALYQYDLIREEGPSKGLSIFKSTHPSDVDTEFGYFLLDNDWNEGQEWIFIFAVYMVDDLEIDLATNTFKGKPLDLRRRRQEE